MHTHTIQNAQNYNYRQPTTLTGEDELSLACSFYPNFETVLQCHLHNVVFIKKCRFANIFISSMLCRILMVFQFQTCVTPIWRHNTSNFPNLRKIVSFSTNSKNNASNCNVSSLYFFFCILLFYDVSCLVIAVFKLYKFSLFLSE